MNFYPTEKVEDDMNEIMQTLTGRENDERGWESHKALAWRR